jgi:hypothetical protein
MAALLAQEAKSEDRTAPCCDPTATELAAGVAPANPSYPPLDPRRYGVLADGKTDDALAWQRAILVAQQTTLSGATGATIDATHLTGSTIVGSLIVLPNRVRIKGPNASGLIFTAAPTHPGPFMFYALNGAIFVASISGTTLSVTSVSHGVVAVGQAIIGPGIAPGNVITALGTGTGGTGTYTVQYAQTVHRQTLSSSIAMFDSLLEDLFIDCANVAGLSAIRASAWQENSGLRNVGIMNFCAYGLKLDTGAGGAGTLELHQCQFFPSSKAAAAACIRVDQISSVGAFLLHVRDSALAGSDSLPVAIGIDVANDSLLCQNCHFEGCVDAVQTGSGPGGGSGSLLLENITGYAGIANMVHLLSRFSGSVNLLGCRRNGAGSLIRNEVSGETLSTDVAQYVYPYVATQNSVKAWCSFDGAEVNPRPAPGSFNIARIAKNGTGDYTIHFARPMFNTGYAVSVSNNGNATDPVWASVITTHETHTRFTIRRGGAFAGAMFDVNRLTVMVAGLGGYQ